MSDIQHAYPLILNKVASPQYANPVLRRQRLIDWLNAASTCRAAVIAADAGYGKTTLLYQWEREVEFPCYWYKLDRNDRDWTFHISYLIEAIGKRHPGFGRRAQSMLEQMGGPGSSRPAVAAYLIAEMHERLTEPCTFIIDDWQYVNAATEVRGLWNQMLRDAPATCRFVFASRVKPKLQFARFKTHAGYAELRTDDLRFTEAEIDALFRDIYNDPLEPRHVEELEKRTEGWAASLQLVEVSLRGRTDTGERRDFIESITATRDSDLFAFLAEEVLDQQPESTRNFLLATSILQQITPEVAERLAGVHDGRRELTELENRGLFTNRLDEHRYRYHNLFRDFLERRLVMERSESEVTGLHIHAASYFETTEQWPEAIHHYLRAGLQRQAARLIAKYGEDVVVGGRLGSVDTWLQDLAPDSIRQNARLSLLHGEALGIRGQWDDALAALERARAFFARKGDRRLEALASLKLSTVYSNAGDAERAAATAESGLALVSNEDSPTALRLEGNLAITKTRLRGDLSETLRQCHRVAEAASALGFEHFAAIGYYNVGDVLLRMGDIPGAVRNLEKAHSYWAESAVSPFGNTEDLVAALLADGQLERARSVAMDSVRRTAPWPRPRAYAQFGLALVLIAEGRLEEAADALERLTPRSATLGGGHRVVFGQLVEVLYLMGRPKPDILAAVKLFTEGPADSRYAADVAPAQAIAEHIAGSCAGSCQMLLRDVERTAEEGAQFAADIARVKIRSLALEHKSTRAKRDAWRALIEAHRRGSLAGAREWVRRYAPYARYATEVQGGAALLARLVEDDPSAWRSAAISLLPDAERADRADMLHAVVASADNTTADALKSIQGADIALARRTLIKSLAPRLYIRTFGGLSLRRDGWNGGSVPVDRKRVSSLVAILVAHGPGRITRDMAIELLWPDADADAALNSLNQTVFQLRRCFDPHYRQRESVDYLDVTSDHLGFDTDLVLTDLDRIRDLPTLLEGPSRATRQQIASDVVGLVRGEFLSDHRYESWAGHIQLFVHNEVRAKLLPIAVDAAGEFDAQIAAQAASALIALDPFDEPANIALAGALERSGQRIAARAALMRFADRLEADMDGEVSVSVQAAIARLRSIAV